MPAVAAVAAGLAVEVVTAAEGLAVAEELAAAVVVCRDQAAAVAAALGTWVVAVAAISPVALPACRDHRAVAGLRSTCPAAVVSPWDDFPRLALAAAEVRGRATLPAVHALAISAEIRGQEISEEILAPATLAATRVPETSATLPIDRAAVDPRAAISIASLIYPAVVLAVG